MIFQDVSFSDSRISRSVPFPANSSELQQVWGQVKVGKREHEIFRRVPIGKQKNQISTVCQSLPLFSHKLFYKYFRKRGYRIMLSELKGSLFHTGVNWGLGKGRDLSKFAQWISIWSGTRAEVSWIMGSSHHTTLPLYMCGKYMHVCVHVRVCVCGVCVWNRGSIYPQNCASASFPLYYQLISFSFLLACSISHTCPPKLFLWVPQGSKQQTCLHVSTSKHVILSGPGAGGVFVAVFTI